MINLSLGGTATVVLEHQILLTILVTVQKLDFDSFTPFEVSVVKDDYYWNSKRIL